jgi:hypothetical protein
MIIRMRSGKKAREKGVQKRYHGDRLVLIKVQLRKKKKV